MCSDCCMKCLYWWSARCPYGGCYDDLRAKTTPRKKVTGEHWTFWSRCEDPGEQDHWCRGGMLHPVDVEKECPQFIAYTDQIIKHCLEMNVSVFQDGYIRCGIVDMVGCERCYEEFLRKQEE